MTYSRILLCLALALAVLFVFPLVAGAQPQIPHTLEGRSTCTACHQVGGSGAGAPGGTGLPANHQGRADAICTGCHTAAAAAPKPATPAPAATAAPKPAAPAATPAPAATTAPAKPAATPAPTTVPAQVLPRSGGPSAGLLATLALSMLGLGWAVRRYTLRK